MKRREFLKVSFAGISSFAINRLIVPPSINKIITPRPTIRYSANYLGLNMYELFSSYAGRVGADIVEELRDTRLAREERDRINGIMSENGYTDFSESSYFRHGNNSTGIEFYIIGNENSIDVCAPFFPNYVADTKKPLFESAAVIGTAVATAQYEFENPRATTRNVADIFLPKDHINNAGLAAFLDNPVRTNSLHETANGELEVNFTPGGRFDDGKNRVQVQARGKIEFDETYPFDIV